jgi:hypothetical protein
VAIPRLPRINLDDRFVLGDGEGLSRGDSHEVGVDHRDTASVAQSEDEWIGIAVDTFTVSLLFIPFFPAGPKDQTIVDGGRRSAAPGLVSKSLLALKAHPKNRAVHPGLACRFPAQKLNGQPNRGRRFALPPSTMAFALRAGMA